ncbi:MAG: hypothetical protein HKM07_00810 [Chlamydiae bacterium]|nr:hypothetical protein [Chlamydiota bacterium]
MATGTRSDLKINRGTAPPPPQTNLDQIDFTKTGFIDLTPQGGIPKKPTAYKSWLEDMCTTALAVYACYTSYRVFLPIFTASFIYGACFEHDKEKFRAPNFENKPLVLIAAFKGREVHDSCLGSFEDLTAIRFHTKLKLVVATFLALRHVEEDSAILVPYGAATTGIRAGQLAMEAYKNYTRKV